MKALEGDAAYNRVVVKHGGTDENGTSVTYTEELSQTDEYGILDWNCLGMAFREFASNAIDAAIAVNHDGNTKYPWDGVKVELVPEEKVRAKRGWTRVFVPADNEEVIRFFANLGKWFLHFSEPEAITGTILTKKSRNLDPNCHTAVIYRRGVRVREIEQYASESLFDYNLNDLRVDESRNVDDYQCRNAAARAMAKASPEVPRPMDSVVPWRHTLLGASVRRLRVEARLGRQRRGQSPPARRTGTRPWNWSAIASCYPPRTDPWRPWLARAIDPFEVPETVVRAAEEYGCPTPSKILSADELDGRESFDPTPDAVAALDWVWEQVNVAG